MRLLVLLSLLTACAEEPPVNKAEQAPPLDRNDPVAVARKVLTAYKAKDLAVLQEFAGKNTRPVLDEMIAEGERHPSYKNIFLGYRWETVSAWTGSLSEARYSPLTAYVAFGEHRDRPVVVKLVREGAAWLFEDIARVSGEYLSSLPEEPPK